MTSQHGARILSCLGTISSLEVTPGSLFSPFRHHQTFQPFCSDARVLSWEEWGRPQYNRVSHLLVPLWRRALLLDLGTQGQSERFPLLISGGFKWQGRSPPQKSGWCRGASGSETDHWLG